MTTYRLVREVDSGWHLYRDDELLDVESVSYYDDRVQVPSWTQMPMAGKQQEWAEAAEEPSLVPGSSSRRYVWRSPGVSADDLAG